MSCEKVQSSVVELDKKDFGRIYEVVEKGVLVGRIVIWDEGGEMQFHNLLSGRVSNFTVSE